MGGKGGVYSVFGMVSRVPEENAKKRCHGEFLLSMFFTCLYSSGENVIEDAEFEDMIEYSIDIYFGFVPPEEIVEVMESLRKETQYEVQKMQQESKGISSPS